jgi:hypothetical protein
MNKHTWQIDLTADFEASAAELEAANAGPAAVAELKSIYESKLEAFFAAAGEGHQAALKGLSGDRGAVLASFARGGRLAEAAWRLPRKDINREDFEATPIFRPGLRTPSWHRTDCGGVWVVTGLTRFRAWMIYRAIILGGHHTSRN